MNSQLLKSIISNRGKIHLIGIGGVSMRALAKLLLEQGAVVSGSDKNQSDGTSDLEKKGADVIYSHFEDNVEGASLVVRTAAIGDDNEEVIAAKKLDIPVLERAQVWGLIMEDYKNVICFSGTHGKTTATSMMTYITMRAALDPTVMVGSSLKNIDDTLRVGQKDYFVAEACEYCNSFLSFKPTVAVVLNIEEDHLDFFAGIDDIIGSFNKFLKLVPSYGAAIINGDDENVLRSARNLDCRVLTFGISDKNNIYAKNVTNDHGYYSFDGYYNDKKLGSFSLSVPGIHNVLNALSCIAVCVFKDISFECCAEALKEFTGAQRRFERIGSFNNAVIVDDYAHHPTEIEATLKAARLMGFSRIICVFQPHTYSRTKALFNDFVKVLSFADKIIMTEIFEARGKNTIGISAKHIADKIDNCEFIESFEDISEYLKKEAHDGDIIITMGAGNVNNVGPMLCRIG